MYVLHRSHSSELKVQVWGHVAMEENTAILYCIDSESNNFQLFVGCVEGSWFSASPLSLQQAAAGRLWFCQGHCPLVFSSDLQAEGSDLVLNFLCCGPLPVCLQLSFPLSFYLLVTLR